MQSQFAGLSLGQKASLGDIDTSSGYGPGGLDSSYPLPSPLNSSQPGEVVRGYGEMMSLQHNFELRGHDHPGHHQGQPLEGSAIHPVKIFILVISSISFHLPSVHVPYCSYRE